MIDPGFVKKVVASTQDFEEALERAATVMSRTTNPCPSCGLDYHIVLDKRGTELLVECTDCHYSWTIEEKR